MQANHSQEKTKEIYQIQDHLCLLFLTHLLTNTESHLLCDGLCALNTGH